MTTPAKATEYSLAPGSLQGLLDVQACQAWLLGKLHPREAACPDCKTPLSHPKQTARFWAMEAVRCQECGRTFNALSGTPFHRLQLSAVGIVTLLLLLGFARGTSEIAEQLGVEERTARRWRKRFGPMLPDFSPICIRVPMSTDRDEPHPVTRTSS